jgi:signal transduction histidine kinase
MKIKYFMILLYSAAGLFIATLSAFFTFLIINEPIGFKMLTQIVFAVLLLLPFIAFISYIFANYLLKKFLFIQHRLSDMEEEDFLQRESQSFILEIEQINSSINKLSNRMEMLITNLKNKNTNLKNILLSMAHDVRTPLTILNGYVEELQDGLVLKEKKAFVFKTMQNEIAFLNELSNDILSYIASMKNEKPKETLHVRKIVDEMLLLFRWDDVNVFNDVDKNFGVEFNSLDFKKVVHNLLSNAARYTQKGEVRVFTKENELCFSNTGAVIPKESHEKIFEPFFTLSLSKNREQSGVGLGLAIVKNLCNSNGYECFLAQSNHEKTIFTLVKI